MKRNTLLSVSVVVLVVFGAFFLRTLRLQSTNTGGDEASDSQLGDASIAVRITRYAVKPDFQDQFREALRDYVQHSLAQEDNVMSEAYDEQAHAGVLWLIERWNSRAGLNNSDGSKPAKVMEILSAKALCEPTQFFLVKDLEPLSKQQWRKAAAKQDAPLTVMLFVDAKPGTQAVFQDIYHTAMPHFRGEPGVVTYQLSQFEQDDTQFVTYEKFRSDEAFQYHLRFPPVKPVIAYLETSIKKPPFQNGLHKTSNHRPYVGVRNTRYLFHTAEARIDILVLHQKNKGHNPH